MGFFFFCGGGLCLFGLCVGGNVYNSLVLFIFDLKELLQ